MYFAKWSYSTTDDCSRETNIVNCFKGFDSKIEMTKYLEAEMTLNHIDLDDITIIKGDVVELFVAKTIFKLGVVTR